ncbi:DUF1345 domain-containing protein [Paracoccus suum]|uniref:DUF1345 domain-containing protein n=1 Tax=Paracoccus suum TaxID=2259340 RepID=A0A344PNH9_9RHOB|nr:DUF1345 domain-containing protein [Paracoccus suum]AXC50934.1 DUF1345 domain-containing protein [Paracoccus suum]
MNFKRHGRFLVGLLLGAVAALAIPGTLIHRLMIGADVLFAFYLLTTWLMARHLTPDDLAEHARAEDEGIGIIMVIALCAVAISLVAIFEALASSDASNWARFAPLISVPLGWVAVHTLFTFRYSHLWYAPGDDPDENAEGSGGGLDFGENCPRPGLIEFFYYSFTVAMTAQTSDVAVTSADMRRLTLMQAVLSFLYNTVLIALAVNAAMSGGG